jgi:hypothetical protein
MREDTLLQQAMSAKRAGYEFTARDIFLRACAAQFSHLNYWGERRHLWHYRRILGAISNRTNPRIVVYPDTNLASYPCILVCIVLFAYPDPTRNKHLFDPGKQL